MTTSPKCHMARLLSVSGASAPLEVHVLVICHLYFTLLCTREIGVHVYSIADQINNFPLMI